MERPKTCTTHGHDLRGEGMLVGGGVQGKGDKGKKKWDNCNSIINKIYLKNKNKIMKINRHKNISPTSGKLSAN